MTQNKSSNSKSFEAREKISIEIFVEENLKDLSR